LAMSLRSRSEAFSSATAGSSTTRQPKRCSGGAGRPKAWLVCVLDYEGRHREVMGGRSWTELFFLDEAVALAAGHRPCFFCRRAAAEAFRTAWGKAKGGKAPLAPEMDAILHEERLDRGRKRVHAIPGPIAELPDGTVIVVVGEAYTIVRGRAFRWSERGYQVERQIPLADGLLTPPSTLLAIRRKPRRSRANLRPPSPFASVIDRLLKNQNLLENRNNLRPSSPHLVVGRRPGTAPQFCGSKVHGHREPRTARRSAAAASRGPRPGASRAGWRLRQSHHRLQQAIAVLSSAGDASRPHHALFLDRKIAARLFRRCQRPVEARIMPDSYFSSVGSAFTEIG
jgi:hypothetical protein